jgi:DNA-binding transcriptional ArsR family regulator
VRRVRVINDLETLKLIAEPTRAAILESLTRPQSATQLAAALHVPRTRLYHHLGLLESKGLIEQVDQRQAGALTERVYGVTARVFRPSKRLLRSGNLEDRLDAITTLLFDTTKSDFRRAVEAGDIDLDRDDEVPQLAMGRSIALLTPDQVADFVEELSALVERYDDAHSQAVGTRPFALVWALYPSSRRIR